MRGRSGRLLSRAGRSWRRSVAHRRVTQTSYADGRARQACDHRWVGLEPGGVGAGKRWGTRGSSSGQAHKYQLIVRDEAAAGLLPEVCKAGAALSRRHGVARVDPLLPHVSTVMLVAVLRRTAVVLGWAGAVHSALCGLLAVIHGVGRDRPPACMVLQILSCAACVMTTDNQCCLRRIAAVAAF